MSAEIIEFEKKKKEDRVCSFCKITESKSKSMVQSMINDHCICNECIKKCKELLETK